MYLHILSASDVKTDVKDDVSQTEKPPDSPDITNSAAETIEAHAPTPLTSDKILRMTTAFVDHNNSIGSSPDHAGTLAL